MEAIREDLRRCAPATGQRDRCAIERVPGRRGTAVGPIEPVAADLQIDRFREVLPQQLDVRAIRRGHLVRHLQTRPEDPALPTLRRPLLRPVQPPSGGIHCDTDTFLPPSGITAVHHEVGQPRPVHPHTAHAASLAVSPVQGRGSVGDELLAGGDRPGRNHVARATAVKVHHVQPAIAPRVVQALFPCLPGYPSGISHRGPIDSITQDHDTIGKSPGSLVENRHATVRDTDPIDRPRADSECDDPSEHHKNAPFSEPSDPPRRPTSQGPSSRARRRALQEQHTSSVSARHWVTQTASAGRGETAVSRPTTLTSPWLSSKTRIVPRHKEAASRQADEKRAFMAAFGVRSIPASDAPGAENELGTRVVKHSLRSISRPPFYWGGRRTCPDVEALITTGIRAPTTIHKGLRNGPQRPI